MSPKRNLEGRIACGKQTLDPATAWAVIRQGLPATEREIGRMISPRLADTYKFVIDFDASQNQTRTLRST